MTRRLVRTALLLAISLALSALVLRAVPALPTYGAQQPQFQLPNVNNSLLLLTAAADFNCDGLTDVILVRGILGTNTLVPVSVMLANGAGGFIDGTAQIFSGPVPQPMWPRKLLVDDFNGDGRPDVFIADTGNDGGDSVANGNQNILLLSTAGCQLTNATANLPQQSDYTHSAASADIDNDGDVDLYVGNVWGINNIPPQIWRNDGTGHFTVAAGLLPGPQTNLDTHRYTSSLFVDVNGDDYPDLVLGGVNFPVTQSAVLLNDGTGHFSALAGAMPSKPFGADAIALDIKSADFNHDGAADLVIVFTKNNPYYQGRWEQILINNGSGIFSDQTATRLPQVDNLASWDIFAHLVDFDGDGNHDLIAESIDNNTGNRFFTANGSGNFTSVPLLPGGFNLFSLVDAAGDGHRDMLAIGYNVFGLPQVWKVPQLGSVLPPGTPLGVRASRGLAGHVRVSWPYVWGATTYEVWRSDTVGSTGVSVGTVSATSFDDASFPAGLNWYYRVRAVNSAGTSAYSKVTRGSPLQELLPNGTFQSGSGGWQVFATDGVNPNLNFIQASVVNGVLEFYRVTPPPGTSNQATVFVDTGQPVPTDSPVTAQFDLGNSSTARKRVTVLINDSDFSDITVCTFWLLPQTALQTYTMQTHTTKAWTSAAIYFYAATDGASGGAYRLDNVSLHRSNGPANSTVCNDPTAPATLNLPDQGELVVNGDFSNGLTGWSTFNNIVVSPPDTSFYFYRPPSALPAGGILQPGHTSVNARAILTARFTLANTSAVRKRVTVLMHEFDFTDLAACTFWVPPGQLMNPANVYVMRTFNTKAWTSAYLSFYAATSDNLPWTGLDNVSWHTTPSSATSGTDCGEPGSTLSGGSAPGPAPAPAALARALTNGQQRATTPVRRR